MQNKRVVLWLLLLGAVTKSSGQSGDWRPGFLHPPDSVRPSVYWYWLDDNISAEGVQKDITTMAHLGIGRAFIGNIGFSPGDMNLDYTPDTLFSPNWWKATQTALQTGAAQGVDIGIFNGPGWSQSGGPWIKDSEAMRYLTAKEQIVCGPTRITEQWTSRPSFRDVAILAYPTPPGDSDDIALHDAHITASTDSLDLKALFDHDPNTKARLPPDSIFSIEITTPQPYTARSLTIEIAPPAMSAHVTIYADPDPQKRSAGPGETIIATIVKSFDFDRSNPALNTGFLPWGPITASFPATISKHFTIVLKDIHGRGTFTGIRLSGAARTEKYIEKQLGKMFPSPLPLWNEYQWPEQATIADTSTTINPAQVLDLTQHHDPNGTFTWDVPKGNWTIVRLGMTPTGVTNSPAAPEGTGLDVDKLSTKAVEYHFDHFIGRILEHIPAADRQAFKYVVADSYETGSQNWTDDLAAAFKATYDYDPLPWLPVLTGHVVESPDKSDRFLWDLRRLIADKVAYDYVGGLRNISHRHGLKLWLENYGHWGFPSEFLLYGSQSDEVAGEFWAEGDLGSIECRDASSSAHTYGRQIVTAESFTSAGNAYGRYPATLKHRADWSFTEGINNTLFHVYIHQPNDTKKPGVNAWFGTEFNRNNTWFPQAKVFVDYIRRCNFMLRQGLPVDDVAYFIGEDAPKMTGIRDPKLPDGYQFDYVNADVIEHRMTVRNGRLTLPDGMSYRLLVLPRLTSMRPELLQKLAELVHAGATIIGPPPDHSPSLQHGDSADRIVRTLAATLWPKHNRPSTGGARPGHILDSMSIEQAIGARPDFQKNTTADIRYIHRTTREAEIYFVSNQTDTTINFTPSFRMTKGTPLWCDAVTGTTRPLPILHRYSDHTDIPLKLEANGSGFVVFTTQAAAAEMPTAGQSAPAKVNFPAPQILTTLSNPWTVTFDTSMRGPSQPIRFDSLTDWSQNSLDSIKNYSGIAIYHTTFNLTHLPADKKLYLDLGKVKVLASVKLNGIDLGTAWTAPWRVDMSPAIHSGVNTLEIKVVNTWINRLIGDSRLPSKQNQATGQNQAAQQNQVADQRRTWTNVNDFKPSSPYDPSGLMGPVTIQTLDY